MYCFLHLSASVGFHLYFNTAESNPITPDIKDRHHHKSHNIYHMLYAAKQGQALHMRRLQEYIRHTASQAEFSCTIIIFYTQIKHVIAATLTSRIKFVQVLYSYIPFYDRSGNNIFLTCQNLTFIFITLTYSRVLSTSSVCTLIKRIVQFLLFHFHTEHVL